MRTCKCLHVSTRVGRVKDVCPRVSRWTVKTVCAGAQRRFCWFCLDQTAERWRHSDCLTADTRVRTTEPTAEPDQNSRTVRRHHKQSRWEISRVRRWTLGNVLGRRLKCGTFCDPVVTRRVAELPSVKLFKLKLRHQQVFNPEGPLQVTNVRTKG